MNSIVSALRKIDTFATLSDGDLSILARLCVPDEWSAGTTIIKEGFEGDSMFLLTSGSVEIWVDYETEKADMLAIRSAPTLVGEMSMADKLPRSATIVTRVPSSGYVIDATDIRSIIKKRGSIGLSLMEGFSRIVRSSNNIFVKELRQRNQELISVNRDLKNTQKRLVRQERLTSLGKFSSMIIHDINNPLSVIKAYTDILDLKISRDMEEINKYISNIRRETDRLSSLVEEWLDYSRGDLRLKYSSISIGDFFDSICQSVSDELDKRKIKFQCNVVPVNNKIFIDRERLQRALVNVLDNARKACKAGDEIIITVDKDEAGKLYFRIKDSGSGMNDETLHHIFEPFYSTSEQGGTGLGMHIVKTIVHAHGGHIDVKSAIGEGTEITIILPDRS